MSRNYTKMRDRLRLRLKKKKEQLEETTDEMDKTNAKKVWSESVAGRSMGHAEPQTKVR